MTLRSSAITQGVQRAPNRAMLRAVGFGEDDFTKPIVGIANGFSTITPCNAGLDVLARRAEAAVRGAGGMPQLFGTITVSDGISMGTEGMKYSLVSREVIADSIETACNAESMDGVVAIGGCDKNMPGAMIAIARMNIPAVFVYGGTIKPGHLDGEDLTIVSAFEAVGQFGAGKIDAARLHAVECHACPGAGSCGGMYTANTMSSAIEAMGMSLPGSSTMSAEDAEKAESAARSGQVLVERTRRRHAAELAAARDALFRRRVDASVEPGVSPGSLRVRCPVPEGNTLVVVPESASRRSLERALRSLRRHTKRPGVEIVSLRSPADLRSLEPEARWLVWVEPTLEALHDDWLECLLGELAYPGTVAVSPRLVNESGASLYAGDGSGTAADDYYWDVARRIAAPHASCFAATRAALADVELPFEPSALRDVLESRARAWTERGQGVRYTPHTAFCLHNDSGGDKPAARSTRRSAETRNAARKA